MQDEEHPSDYAVPPPRPASTTSLPPAAKISREIGAVVLHVSVVASVTTALLVGKLDSTWYVAIIVALLTGHFALKKGDGAIDAQTLVELLKK